MIFTFTLELFIDNLKVSNVFETGYFDLNIQGQICHENLNVSVIPCECGNF